MTTSTYQAAGICSVLEPFQFTRGDNDPFYQQVQTIFCARLLESWAQLTAESPLAPGAAGPLREPLAQMTAAQLEHYLLQPEVSRRLLFGREEDPRQAQDFFRRTLAAHAARQTHTYDPNRYNRLWSANGDYLIAFNPGSGAFDEYEAPLLAGAIPLDFFSPGCQGLSQEEIHESPDTRFTLYGLEEAEDVYGHLEDALEPLAANANLYELVRRFNKVVMVKKQENADGRRPFISGSDGYYIGRTHVMNPDLASRELLAETFVHEAIHTVLYMLEEHRPWMPGMDAAVRIGIAVPSNWSGNRLSIRSYFQAVFVWFGIWNLWQYARANDLYDPGWVEKRLAYVTRGFATLDLDRMSAAYGIRLPEETVGAVRAARSIVLKG